MKTTLTVAWISTRASLIAIKAKVSTTALLGRGGTCDLNSQIWWRVSYVQDLTNTCHSEPGLTNITNSIPSSLTVGTAQVSVPLVATLKQSLQSTVNLAATAATVMMVLLIIGCISTAFTAVGSSKILVPRPLGRARRLDSNAANGTANTDILSPVLGILRAQSRFLSLVNTGFSILGAGIFLGLAGIATGVVVAGSDSISDLGRGFNLEVKQGGGYIAIMWVAAVLAWIASAYWFMVWFVEFRRSAFSRRHRTSAQIGNWKGIIGEVRKDLKVNGHSGGHTYDGERGVLKA